MRGSRCQRSARAHGALAGGRCSQPRRSGTVAVASAKFGHLTRSRPDARTVIVKDVGRRCSAFASTRSSAKGPSARRASGRRAQLLVAGAGMPCGGAVRSNRSLRRRRPHSPCPDGFARRGAYVASAADLLVAAPASMRSNLPPVPAAKHQDVPRARSAPRESPTTVDDAPGCGGPN